MMMNNDFQEIVKSGDVLFTDAGSARFRADEKYEFIKFHHCKHSVYICEGCRGMVNYIDLNDIDERKRIDCLREYKENKVGNDLVVAVEIISGTVWFEEEDFIL